MELQELTYGQYAALFANSAPTVFDRPDFVDLNAHYMHRVVYLAGDGLGIALGQNVPGDRWRSPFSAPYATVCGRGDMEAFAAALRRWTAKEGAEFVCPPYIYGMDAWREALTTQGIVVARSRNYHFDLDNFENRRHFMTPSARNNLNRAMRQGFEMERTDDLPLVYNFIAEHHRQLGYRMAMTLDDVWRTCLILPVELFRFTLDGRTVGATIYYRTAPGIAQLINCGDDLSLRKLHPMTFMTEAALAYYHERGFRYVDLGPVMLNGTVNQGLDSFKRSMGFTPSDKHTILFPAH